VKILLIGRGWVGKKLFAELVSRKHTTTLVSHEQGMEQIDEQYDWVVNCAGLTGIPNVDYCETEVKKTFEANAIYPVLLYKMCEKKRIKLAHFSSGCIYKGVISSTDQEPNYFGSVYSISKGVSDTYLLDKAVLFRIRMPFTGEQEDKNLFTKLIKYARLGKLIEGGPNSISDLDEAIKVSCDILEKNCNVGAYNLVNKGTATTHEISDMLGLNPQWYTLEEFKKITIAGRSNCVIPSYSGMSPIKEALIKRISEYRGDK